MNRDNGESQSLALIRIAQAQESLRQQAETFDLQKMHDARWNWVRIGMSVSSIVLLFAVAGVAGWVLLNPDSYPDGVLMACASALFADVIGVLVGVYKVVLAPGSVTPLEPVTAFPTEQAVDLLEAPDEAQAT